VLAGRVWSVVPGQVEPGALLQSGTSADGCEPTAEGKNGGVQAAIKRERGEES
jgi:hypothetical protein